MKLYSTLLLIASVTFFGLAACKKNNNTNPNSGNSMPLTLSYTVSGNTVTLTWNLLPDTSVSEYMIFRTGDSTSDKTIKVSKNTATFTDTLPFCPKTRYHVRAITPRQQPGFRNSNTVMVDRTDISFTELTPFDALYDRDNQLIVAYDLYGHVATYDLNAKKWTQQISVGTHIVYCDLGVYNGKTELYVPTTQGALLIYDAATLTKIDEINIGTEEIFSVCYNNGILYLDGPFGEAHTLSYRRSTKSVVGQAVSGGRARLKLRPGTNSEFYSIDGINSGLHHYSFDNNGNPISYITKYPPYGKANSLVFEMFPDGNNFISSAAGCIFDSGLSYVTTLPHGSASFTSFCFDNGHQLIYGSTNQKQIQAYDMNSYQLTKTINTQGNLCKVFYDNGTVISVSYSDGFLTKYISGERNFSFIERF